MFTTVAETHTGACVPQDNHPILEVAIKVGKDKSVQLGGVG